jgi:transcription factor IIIB subunit 2
MMSVPMIRASTGSGKPKPKKPNPIRRIMNQEQRIRERSVASSPSAGTPAAATPSNRPVCKNPQCDRSDVRDGACQNCGRVVWESNIVAEVTFGETSSGAAVVHGSYLAADQGSIRPTAGSLPFRRVAGSGASEARERSLREAKQLLNQFAYQLQIPPHVAEKAFQTYKIASTSNFIQGRRKNTVAAVCLYAICRKEDNNKVMLIDLADIIKVDVFLLGRCYKDLLNAHGHLKEGTKPIIIEDLIFRFASKLEFLHDTNKVALSAIRIAQRMRHDNITHGRRPAGICGAAIIMAARAHNYRRTVREVVYIAKVTMATLQERMEEFANVPAAQMTIQEFEEARNLPEASHDPPFVYKQTKEWQEKHPKKGRKRKAAAISQDANQPASGTEQQPSAKRQTTASSSSEPQPSSVPIDPALQAGTTATEVPAPSVLTPSGEVPPTSGTDEAGSTDSFRRPTADELSIANAATKDADDQLQTLAQEFGDPEDEESEDEIEVDPSSEMAMAAAQGIQIPGMENMKIRQREGPSTAEEDGKDPDNGSGDADGGKKKPKPRLRIDEEWELDENNLENEMQGHLNDPAMIGASAAVTREVEQRREKSAARKAQPSITPTEPITNLDTTTTLPAHNGSDKRFTPTSKVSDDPIVHEDEFKDDPEVMFCKLSERDVLLKEMIWANHNKDYMRKIQQKIFEAKVSKKEPKQRSGRPRKPRIGEGQTTPASSATEAAQNMLRTRAISTKLDYTRMGNLFEFSKGGPGSTYGGTSSVGSRSALPSSAGSDAGSDSGAQASTPTPGTPTAASTVRERVAKALALPEEEEEEEEEDGGAEMYENGFDGPEDFQDETFGEEDFDPFGDTNGGDDYEE